VKEQSEPLRAHQSVIKGEEQNAERDGSNDKSYERVGHGLPLLFKGVG